MQCQSFHVGVGSENKVVASFGYWESICSCSHIHRIIWKLGMHMWNFGSLHLVSIAYSRACLSLLINLLFRLECHIWGMFWFEMLPNIIHTTSLDHMQTILLLPSSIGDFLQAPTTHCMIICLIFKVRAHETFMKICCWNSKGMCLWRGCHLGSMKRQWHGFFWRKEHPWASIGPKKKGFKYELIYSSWHNINLLSQLQLRNLKIVFMIHNC